MSSPVVEVGNYKNLSASGQVLATRGQFLGIFCASSSAATCKVWDSLTATGLVVANTFTLESGRYYAIPASVTVGAYVTITGTADITTFANPSA